MIFRECMKCKNTDLIEVGDNAGCYCKNECSECGEVHYTYLSRIEPHSLNQEAFDELIKQGKVKKND